MPFAQDTKGCCQVSKYILPAFWLYFPEKFCLWYDSNGSSHKAPQYEGCLEHTELATEQYVCEASQIYDSKSKESMIF